MAKCSLVHPGDGAPAVPSPQLPATLCGCWATLRVGDSRGHSTPLAVSQLCLFSVSFIVVCSGARLRCHPKVALFHLRKNPVKRLSFSPVTQLRTGVQRGSATCLRSLSVLYKAVPHPQDSRSGEHFTSVQASYRPPPHRPSHRCRVQGGHSGPARSEGRAWERSLCGNSVIRKRNFIMWEQMNIWRFNVILLLPQMTHSFVLFSDHQTTVSLTPAPLLLFSEIPKYPFGHVNMHLFLCICVFLNLLLYRNIKKGTSRNNPAHIKRRNAHIRLKYLTCKVF